MIEHIFSKVDPNVLLHIVVRNDCNAERADIVEPDQRLQVSVLNLKAGKEFKPHVHSRQDIPQVHRPAQETWIVISGKVKAMYYDINGKKIAERILLPGECSITLAGGHNYKAMENAKVYEVKSGPYYGQQLDKRFI